MKKTDVGMITKLPPPIGGVTIHSLRLVTYLENIGLNVKVVNPELKNIFQIFLLCCNAKNLHIHSLKFATLFWPILLFLKKIIKKNVILTVHSLRKIPKFKFHLFKTPSIVVAVNQEISKKIQEITKQEVIPKVISPFFPPDESERNFFEKLSQKEIKFLTEYRIISFNASKIAIEDGIDIYGIDTMIEAFSLLKKEKNRLKLCMCIPNINKKMNDYLRGLINNYGVNSDDFLLIERPVWFIDVLEKSSIFVRANRSDGDPLSVKEALYLGIPVVASDCVKRPNGAFIFKTGDQNNLVEVIQNTLKKKALNTINKLENSYKNIAALYKE